MAGQNSQWFQCTQRYETKKAKRSSATARAHHGVGRQIDRVFI